MPKLAVAIDWPNAHVPWPCWSSLWHSEIRREPDVMLMRGVGPDGSLNANAMVRQALAEGVDELILLSADQEIPPKFLSRCRELNKDVVGVQTISRQKGHPWLVARFQDDHRMEWVTPKEAVESVDMVGIGCSYYRMDVFKRVPAPWFQNILTPDGCDLIVSNDFFFFKKCKDYGIEVVLDSTKESPHHHEFVLTAKSLHRTAPFLIEVHE